MEDGTSAQAAPLALDLLNQACYPRGDFVGDGEGCLYMGRLLLEHRGRLGWHASDRAPSLSAEPAVNDPTLISTVQDASRAFAKGCLSNWQGACDANEGLAGDWIAGAYPHLTATCQIRDADGDLRSEKPCQMIRYVVPVIVDADNRNIHDETVYVWPDGDRTVVRDGPRRRF